MEEEKVSETGTPSQLDSVIAFTEQSSSAEMRRLREAKDAEIARLQSALAAKTEECGRLKAELQSLVDDNPLFYYTTRRKQHQKLLDEAGR